MILIHINIGSNIDKKKNIKLALKNLSKYFNKLVLSSIYETDAVGFSGDNFYNLGVNITTDLTIVAINEILYNIELSQGRVKNSKKFSARTIDLDLTLYGEKIDIKHNIPRDDILKYNFVLAPLVEIMSNSIHPQEKITYNDLWQKLMSAKTLNIKKHNINILEKK